MEENQLPQVDVSVPDKTISIKFSEDPKGLWRGKLTELTDYGYWKGLLVKSEDNPIQIFMRNWSEYNNCRDKKEKERWFNRHSILLPPNCKVCWKPSKEKENLLEEQSQNTFEAAINIMRSSEDGSYDIDISKKWPE